MTDHELSPTWKRADLPPAKRQQLDVGVLASSSIRSIFFRGGGPQIPAISRFPLAIKEAEAVPGPLTQLAAAKEEISTAFCPHCGQYLPDVCNSSVEHAQHLSACGSHHEAELSQWLERLNLGHYLAHFRRAGRFVCFPFQPNPVVAFPLAGCLPSCWLPAYHHY
jgi:hypothetical protein